MRDTDEDADVLKARRGRSEVVTEQIRDEERGREGRMDGGVGGGNARGESGKCWKEQ